MRACDCDVVLPIPEWVPSAVAGGLAVVIAAIIAIVYACHEMERHKNYYGREDKLSGREDAEQEKKEEVENAAFGGSTDEVLVTHTQSPGNKGVKVMMPRKRMLRTPVPAMSRDGNLLDGSPHVSIAPHSLTINIMADKTGRAFELLNVLQAQPDPVLMGKPLRIAENVVENVQATLEKMTNHHYVVYGVLSSDKQLIVKGQQNLLDDVDEMLMQMRLQVLMPIQMTIMAYQVQAAAAAATPVLVTGIEPPSGQFVKEPPLLNRVNPTRETPNNKETQRETPLVTPQTRTNRSIKPNFVPTKRDTPIQSEAETPVLGGSSQAPPQQRRQLEAIRSKQSSTGPVMQALKKKESEIRAAAERKDPTQQTTMQTESRAPTPDDGRKEPPAATATKQGSNQDTPLKRGSHQMSFQKGAPGTGVNTTMAPPPSKKAVVAETKAQIVAGTPRRKPSTGRAPSAEPIDSKAIVAGTPRKRPSTGRAPSAEPTESKAAAPAAPAVPVKRTASKESLAKASESDGTRGRLKAPPSAAKQPKSTEDHP